MTLPLVRSLIVPVAGILLSVGSAALAQTTDEKPVRQWYRSPSIERPFTAIPLPVDRAFRVTRAPLDVRPVTTRPPVTPATPLPIGWLLFLVSFGIVATGTVATGCAWVWSGGHASVTPDQVPTTAWPHGAMDTRLRVRPSYPNEEQMDPDTEIGRLAKRMGKSRGELSLAERIDTRKLSTDVPEISGTFVSRIRTHAQRIKAAREAGTGIGELDLAMHLQELHTRSTEERNR